MTQSADPSEYAGWNEDEVFRLLVASVKDYAIFMLDPQGRVMTWNAGAERLKGYRAEEIIGQHFSRFYLEADIRAGKPERELRDAIAYGRFEDEGWRLRKDGSRFWANVILTAVHDATGTLRGFAKVTRDMTDRRRAEEQLAARAEAQASLAELGVRALHSRDVQALLDHAVEAVASTLRTDLVGILELQEDGTSLVLRAGAGWRDGLVGQARIMQGDGSQVSYVLQAVAPVIVEDRQQEARFPQHPLLAEHDVVSSVNVAIQTPDTEQPYGTLGAHSRQPRSFSMEEIHFLSSVANVIATALTRKRAEDHLREAEMRVEQERIQLEQAEKAVHDRDEFLSVAAHELRTPLTALQLQLQALAQAVGRAGVDRAVPEVGLNRRISKALNHTERMADLVERLLDVARIASGRLTFTFEDVELSSLVAGVLEDFREQAESRQCELRVQMRAQPRGKWDRLRIEQVVMNLLSNAMKYGVGKPIDVEVDSANGMARLVVRDQGIGLSPEDSVRIFRRFERAASTRHFGGLGLGLFITRSIVEGHGGTVQVQSEAGRGAMFVVELPLEPQQQSPGAGGGLRDGTQG